MGAECRGWCCSDLLCSFSSLTELAGDPAEAWGGSILDPVWAGSAKQSERAG